MSPSAREVPATDRTGGSGGRSLVRAWQRHGRIVKGLGVAYPVVAAIGKLRYALRHLLRDVLLLLPAIVVFRIAFAFHHAPESRRTADWLFVAVWSALLTPTWVWYGLDSALVRVLHGAQAILWLMVLGFVAMLASQTGVARPRAVGGEASDG